MIAKTLRRTAGALLAVGSLVVAGGCGGGHDNPQPIEIDAVPGELVVGVRAGAMEQPALLAVIAKAGEVMSSDMDGSFYRVRLSSGLTRGDAEAALVHPDIVYVEPNYLAWGYAAPAEAGSNYADMYSAAVRAELEAAWTAYGALTPTGAVKVAVLDTGVLGTHEDLANKVVVGAASGWDVTASPAAGFDAAAGTDPHGHGTEVAGIVAAEVNNTKGIAGVASWKGAGADPGLVKIVPVKVSDALNVSNHAAIANGINWVLNSNGAAPPVYSPRAQVILLSLGSPSPSWTLQNAIQNAKAAGVLVVAAAGNDGTSLMRYPAAYQGANQAVVSVSSVDPSDALDAVAPGAANYGSWVSLLAPGAGLIAPDATAGGSTYVSNLRGSSFAAAYVAGAAALIWSAYPPSATSAAGKLTVDELRAALVSSVKSYDRATGKNVAAGAGRLDLSRALTLAATPGTLQVGSVTFAATSVKGGTAALKGTVTLTGAAPGSGAAIALSSSNAAVAGVPVNVTVPSGARTADFTITTHAVATNQIVDISAVYQTQSPVKGTLGVNAPGITKISLAQTSLAGGVNTTGTVTIDAPAATGGVAVSLTSSDGSAAVPGSVTVLAGATTATFAVTTSSVAAQKTVTITGTTGGASKNVALRVLPLLASVTVSPASVKGGVAATGTVKLNAPAPADTTVTLTQVPSSAAVVPAAVVVLKGASSKTFSIPTVAVAANATVTFHATAGGFTTTPDTTLTVTAPAVSSVAVTPGTVIYYSSAANGVVSGAGKVTLDGAAAVDTTVYLSASDSILAVPSSVTVTHGTSFANFTVVPAAAVADVSVTISASLTQNQAVKKSATVTVKPALSAVSLVLTQVNGGGGTTGTVTLVAAVPEGLAGGVDVALASDSARATVPATVNIAATKTSATFSIASTPAATTVTAGISANLNGVTKTAPLKVLAPTVASLALSQSSVTSPGTVTGTVTLTGAAPTGGVDVTLASSGPAATVPVAGKVTIAAGAIAASFVVTGQVVAVQTNVVISASANGGSKTATLTVGQTPLALVGVALDKPALVGGLAEAAGNTGATGTVTLNRRSTTATTVTLSSSVPAAAAVPASVDVPANSLTATFKVTSAAVAAQTAVVITATYGVVSMTANLVVDTTVALTSLAMAPTSLTPGPAVVSVGTVTLDKPAPTGGVVVALVSNNTGLVTVPASLTIPMGATTGTFDAAAVTAVASDTPVAISATYAGVTNIKIVTLRKAVGSALSPASPMSIEQGATGTVTLALTGPAAANTLVTVTTSDATKVITSGDFTINAGSSSGTFTVGDAGGSGSTATITVTAGGVAQTLTVNVVAAASANVAAFASGPTLAVGNVSPTITLTLDADVAANTAITFSNSDATVATITAAPANVLANARTATFTVTALKVGTTDIGAKVNGGAVQSFTVTVQAPVLASIAANRTALSLAGANTATVTATLDIQAGSAPVVVTAASSDVAVATVSAGSFNITQGNLTGTVTVTGVAAGSATITLVGGGVTKTVGVTVAP